MILRKPYAFFIKIFKPIHILMAVLIAYLIYSSNNILSFFNQYIYSSDSVVGESIRETLVSKFLYIIPIMLIIFSLIFMGVMFRKKKPLAFYVINVFVYLIVLIVNIYIINFLGTMEESIVSIKLVKLNHDLILLNMIVEVISFVLLIIRGIGLNFKKFNFDSDISNLDIHESDKEEIELSLNVDLDVAKRKRKRNLRYFKYIYRENKFIINSVLTVFLCISVVLCFYFYFNSNKKNTEGIIYSMNKFNMRVNESIFIDKGFNNKKITDDYLVVVDISIQSNLKSIYLFLKDFNLEVGEAIFYPQTKYSAELIDIGNMYNKDMLTQEYTNYIVVFEIPEKYIESDLLFTYNDEGIKTKINLNPKNYIANKITQNTNLNQSINFKETLGDIVFTINEFELQEKFLIKYNYCVRENDCVLSKEYIKPSINENFDKHVLKLNVKYKNDSDLGVNTFYNFFSKFGAIEYTIGENKYTQRGNFEELKSKKIDNKNNVYIGVNSNISRADSIKLVFNIRDSVYVYTLK